MAGGVSGGAAFGSATRSTALSLSAGLSPMRSSFGRPSRREWVALVDSAGFLLLDQSNAIADANVTTPKSTATAVP
jgi:hypothetical protein